MTAKNIALSLIAIIWVSVLLIILFDVVDLWLNKSHLLAQ